MELDSLSNHQGDDSDSEELVTKEDITVSLWIDINKNIDDNITEGEIKCIKIWSSTVFEQMVEIMLI